MPTIKRTKQRKIDVDYNISTKKLQIGQRYTYPELCEAIDAPRVEGGSKKAQLANTGELSFKRYFDFEKVGSGVFEITDIYDEPLPIEDERSLGNNVKYAHMITNTICKINDGSPQKEYTRSELWELCGLVNNDYVQTIHNSEPIYIINERELLPIEIYTFFERCGKKANQCINSALNHMQSQNLITWRSIAILTDNTGDNRLATDEEIRNIANIEESVLTDFGYKDIIQVFSHFKSQLYYKRVNDILKNRYGFWTLSKKVQINYHAYNEYKRKNKLSIEDNKRNINQKILKTLDKQSTHYYENIKNKLSDISIQDYITGQRSMMNKYIKTK